MKIGRIFLKKKAIWYKLHRKVLQNTSKTIDKICLQLKFMIVESKNKKGEWQCQMDTIMHKCPSIEPLINKISDYDGCGPNLPADFVKVKIWR